MKYVIKCILLKYVNGENSNMRYENETHDEERAFYGLKDAVIKNCKIDGPADGESAFKECRDIVVEDTFFNLRYPFWHVDNVKISNCTMTENCRAALWYDKGAFIDSCKIIGTQPLCYVKGLVLEDCEMEGCDLSFERSEVNATVRGHIDSVKNPISGRITVDSIGEIILEEEIVTPGACEITVR